MKTQLIDKEVFNVAPASSNGHYVKGSVKKLIWYRDGEYTFFAGKDTALVTNNHGTLTFSEQAKSRGCHVITQQEYINVSLYRDVAD